MYNEPKVYSSYSQNNLGKTLYNLVIKLKPKKIIEFGVLFGYSTIAMATALKDLGEGEIIGYDLFEDYPYKHATLNQAQKNIKKYNVEQFVTLKKISFYDWIKNPEPFDLMHLDISNDGEILQFASKKLKKYIKAGSTLVFEGGTKERDKVSWMIEYQKSPIYPLKNQINYKIINPKFPGLSLI